MAGGRWAIWRGGGRESCVRRTIGESRQYRSERVPSAVGGDGPDVPLNDSEVAGCCCAMLRGDQRQEGKGRARTGRGGGPSIKQRLTGGEGRGGGGTGGGYRLSPAYEVVWANASDGHDAGQVGMAVHRSPWPVASEAPLM